MSSVEERIKNLSPQKRALLEQRRTAMAASAASTPAALEPVAIVGVGCRYPGDVADLQSFARLLESASDAVSDIPADRWEAELYYSPDPTARGKMVSRRGGFLRDVRGFDAEFFGISPREAESMDPQQRLLLEISYEAFENAGIPTTSLQGSTTGVYIGITLAEYAERFAGDPMEIDVYSGTGNYLNVAAGRLSYVYGLQGPCMAVDAACASSLVTIHLACQALRHRECDLALAGGVSLMLAPETTIYLSQTGALAPDGACKTFDARANGYVRAEGCGLLVLKRLSDALGNRDRIHAVIRGSAVSQDGASSGLTVPNGRAQQKVILAALRDAAVNADEVSYVEAHGTGTPLGDPIELNAINEVYGVQRAPDAPLYVGSLKTNLGHAEAAAGVGGVLKALTALQTQRIPAHLHFERLNPLIAIDPSSVRIPTAPVAWPARPERKRLAGVSSFGFSGVIAHVILEEAPASPPRVTAEAMAETTTRETADTDHDALRVLPVTAKHPQALRQALGALERELATKTDKQLASMSYTACARRSHHGHRAWFSYRSKDELRQQLAAAQRGLELPGAALGGAASASPLLVMVFPGQGSQWMGMGRQAMRSLPVFREAIREVDLAMRPWADFSLLEVLSASPGEDPFTRVAVVQPTIFAVQVALARQWKAWGIEPHAVIGHSMGEVAAACVAGALCLEDAAAVICRRSQLVSSTSGRGAMALVEMPAAEVEQAVAPHGAWIEIAAYNGPSTVLLSGEPQAIDELVAALQARGAFCRKVKVDYASHCAQMDPLLPRIRDELKHVVPRRGRVPIYSTARGTILDGSELDSGYWAENLRRPVGFHERVTALLRDGMHAFLEISPHPVLTPAIQKTIDEAGGRQLVVTSLHREEDELRCLSSSLGRLFTLGMAVSFAAFAREPADVVDLPRYAWQRSEFWRARRPERSRAPRGSGEPAYPALGSALRPAVGAEAYYWEVAVSSEATSFLADHRVRGMTVFPGTGYLDLALVAARDALGAANCSLHEVTFRAALTLLSEEPRRVQIALVRSDDGSFAVSVASRDGDRGEWQLHATMRLRLEPSGAIGECLSAPEAPPAAAERRDAALHYRQMQEGGLDYGPTFRGLAELHCSTEEVLGRLRPLDELGLDGSSHVLHPALWDAAHQALAALLARQEGPASEPSMWIPLDLERCAVLSSSERPAVWVRGRATLGEDGLTAHGELTIRDEAGLVLAEISGLTLRRRDADGLDDPGQWFFRPALREVARRDGEGEPGTWLVAGDPSPLRDRVIAEIQRRGHDVVVLPADGSAAEPETLRRSLASVGETRPVHGLLNLRPHGVAGQLTAKSAAAQSSAISTLYLEVMEQARALHGASQGDLRPRLVLVSRAEHSRGARDEGSGAEDVCSELVAAPLQGLARVISSELTRLRCVQICLAGVDADGELAGLMDELCAAEGTTAADAEDELVLRGGTRWARRLVRVEAAMEPSAAPAAAMRLRPEAVYLITGGIGGIGLRLAHWLVERGAAHLVLLGRKAPSQAALAQLATLRASGASVLVRELDVASPAAMTTLFEELEAMPPLRGVLHLAGVLDDATLFQQTAQHFANARAAKIDGALLLHEHTRHRELDFFVTFSAGAALLGAAGQANYAAANAFLDALALHRHGLGLPALSIGWGVWDEIGLAAASAQRGERLREQGLVGIKPELGLRALVKALALPHPYLAILPIRLRRWRAHHPEAEQRSLFKELLRGLPACGEEHELPILEHLAGLEAAERRAQLSRWVAGQIAAVLRRDPGSLPRQQAFSTMGVDSLMALELRNRLERALRVRLQPTMIFNHPNVEALSVFLERKLDQGRSERAPAVAAAPTPARALDERDGAALLGALTRLKKLVQPA